MDETLEPSSSNLDTSKVELLVSRNPTPAVTARDYEVLPYDPRRQYDYVRLIVTVGLLALFAFVVVWVALKSSGSEDVWKRTKDMLQIVLPALTALMGSVLGFYFGTQKNNLTGL
jgi:hypothetical protein